MGCTWLPNLSTYILPCSNSAMKGNNGPNRIPRYCCPNHHRISLMFHCWNQAFRIVGFPGCSPNVNYSWCREQREGPLIWPYHACISSCLMSRFYGRDTIIYTSEEICMFSNFEWFTDNIWKWALENDFLWYYPPFDWFAAEVFWFLHFYYR
jgi:hypothetical protein